MLRPIVVPLDGSPLAEHALVPAVSIARSLHADIHLLRVREAGGMPIMLHSPEDDVYLRAIREQIEGDIGAGKVTIAQPQGAVAKTIVAYAQTAAARMIVMATRRHDGTQRAVLSSVAEKVARRAALPVLLTGPEITPVQRHTDWQCQRILIPLDGSAIARQIVYPTVDLARGLSARITLLTILPSPSLTVGWPAVPFGGTLEPAPRQQEAIAQLENVARLLRSAQVSVDTRVVQTALATHEAILNEAADTHADLIALATRGYGFAKRLAFGSVAHELVKRAAAPMLVLSPTHDGAQVDRRAVGDGVEMNHAGH